MASLFSDVIEWFLSRAGDRRQYKRRAGAFHVWYEPANGSPVQALGTEISPNGLLFAIGTTIDRPEFQIAIGLRNKRFPARVKIVRADKVDFKGQMLNRYACEFTGIAADWWDLVVRYVNDEPEAADRRKIQNQEMSERVDDAYGLLPAAVQSKIVEMLVQRKRLEPPKPGQTPLLKLFYGGLQKQDGKPVHRFNVHSRVMVNGEAVAYDTRFLVGDDGSVKIG